MRIIDDHIHCGNNRRTKFFDLEDVKQDLAEANAQGAVIFAFPEDIYRIESTHESRMKANEYVLEASKTNDTILYPFYFVWNDYIIPDNLSDYAGIKWHRHWDEPKYDYDNPKCDAILEAMKELELPVVLEEEYEYTLRFVNENPELNVIIPHMGFLNGGYDKMSAFFSKPNVYFDTGTAILDAVKNVLYNVGAERVLFGSDVSGTKQPFYNYTKVELEKVLQLDINDQDMSLILADNIERLIPQKFISGH